MQKRFLFSAILDGIVSSSVLSALLDFVLSYLAKDLKIFSFLRLSMISAILLSALFFLFVIRIKIIRELLLFCIISTIFFAITIVLYLILPFTFFSTREVNTGDGMLLLVVAYIYLFLSLVLKSSIVLISIIGKRGQG